MGERKRGLGRGLSALLPGSERGLQHVRTVDIAPNPQQPRQSFDPAALAELVESIREHGVLQPLIVAPIQPAPDSGPRYRLVVGERRLRAARLAGLERVPALVREADSRDSLEIALVENLQRQDLNPVEEALAYQELISAFSLTQEEVGRRAGRSRPAVANSLRLLKLPPEVLEMVRSGSLSEGHARALLALADAARMPLLAQEVVNRRLSVRETEALVARRWPAASEVEAPRRPPPDQLARSLEEGLRGRLGTKVSVHRGRRGGKLVIHFYSDEELDSIYRTILGDDRAWPVPLGNRWEAPPR